MTDLELAPAETDTDDLEVHFVCCENHDMSLCGRHTPASDGWYDTPEIQPTTCAECDLAEMTRRCPIWGTCHG